MLSLVYAELSLVYAAGAEKALTSTPDRLRIGVCA
jgi:hypothetical protein